MAPDAELQAIIPAQFQLCTVIKNNPVPVNSANLPMCLSFHLRRGCWLPCKRAHDHNRTLTAGERQRIIHFVTTQLAKRSAGLPPALTIITPLLATQSLPQASQGYSYWSTSHSGGQKYISEVTTISRCNGAILHRYE
jgi:hypothetical protein